MSRFFDFIENNFGSISSFDKIQWMDIVEILLIAVFVYQFMLWIRNTRAYSLLKGILIVVLFIFIAYFLQMNTILWLVYNAGGYAITAVLIIFQPELRKALEELGHKKIVSSIIPFDSSKNENEGRYSDRTVNEIVRATFEMAEVKTGALIVIEEETVLNEFIRTGIALDSLISSQLLINIFEHNTPLHDGAVIVRGDRIIAATCYLPLSDNLSLNKNLGTRHRAGVGISEVSDSLTIIVSEETGRVSVARNGKLQVGLTKEELKDVLVEEQNKNNQEKQKHKSKLKLWKGLVKNEKNMINKFTLKVLSLIIAILIWLLVRNVDDPIVVRTFYEIPVSIENASYLAENLEIPLLVDGKDTVKVRVKGARSVVSKLKKEDIKAVADMTQIISKDTTPIMVPVEVTGTGISDSDITVRPRNIQVDIEKQKSVEKTIAVSTGDTQPDKDYEIGNLKANPEKVTISGPETIINKIDKVVALIDVTGRKESNIEIKSQLKIYDKNLDELSPKQLEYLNIKEISDNTIRIQAQFWKVKQNVKIKAEYSGEPKRGYEVDSINLVPDTISVAGTDEALKKLEQEGNTLEIPGKYIDVTDKTGDFEQNIDLSELLPEDLKLVRDLNSSVIATVKILPYNSRDYEVSVTQIEADNKAEDLDLVFQDEQITIRAKAKEQDLDSLSAANIQVQIDLSGYGEGEYEVPVTVTLPGGYELVESIKVKVKLVPGAEK